MPIKFKAALPPVASAIRIDGQDGASRICLDVPAEYRMAVYKMAELGGVVFTVTVEVEEN